MGGEFSDRVMIDRLAILVYPDHQQIISADQYILPVPFHGTDHFTGTCGSGHPIGLSLVHLSMLFPVLIQCMQGNVGPHTARTEYGDPDPFLTVLGPQAFMETKQRMLGGSICASHGKPEFS